MLTKGIRMASSEGSRLWLFIRVQGLMAATTVLLSFVPLKRLLAWLPTPNSIATTAPHNLQQVARYLDDFLRWVPFPRTGRCLCRSLVLYYFAIRSGLPVRLICGVRRGFRKLEGHAWLVLDEKPLYEKGHPENDFVVTFSFPATTSRSTR